METLRLEIEKKRNQLNLLAEKYGLSDKRVLKKSHELDYLLNRYQRESNPYHKDMSLGGGC